MTGTAIDTLTILARELKAEVIECPFCASQGFGDKGCVHLRAAGREDELVAMLLLLGGEHRIAPYPSLPYPHDYYDDGVDTDEPIRMSLGELLVYIER